MHCDNGVVVLDEETLATVIAMSPKFVGTTEAQLKMYFAWAQGIVNNSVCSIVPCDERIQLYYLLIAYYLTEAQKGTEVVGKITSATQGSVSMGYQPVSAGAGSDVWFLNDFGKQFWLMTDQYRLMNYSPGPSKLRAYNYPVRFFNGGYGYSRRFF